MNDKRPLTRSARNDPGVILRRLESLNLGASGRTFSQVHSVRPHRCTRTGRLSPRLGVLNPSHELQGSDQPAYPNLQEPIKPKSY